MPRGICIYCKSIFDISDEVVECTACTAVMRVVDWDPFELELLEPGAIDAEKVKPMTEEDLNKYSTGGRRFIAGFVDGMVLLPISLIDSWALDPGRPPTLIAAWLFFSYSAGWAYSVFMHGLYGQTIGKMVCRVKVLDISEQPITMRQAFIRESVIIVISAVSLILSLYEVLSGGEVNLRSLAITQVAIGLAASAWFVAEMLTLLTNEKRRAIHDFIAGTVVVRVRNQSQDRERV